ERSNGEKPVVPPAVLPGAADREPHQDDFQRASRSGTCTSRRSRQEVLCGPAQLNDPRDRFAPARAQSSPPDKLGSADVHPGVNAGALAPPHPASPCTSGPTRWSGLEIAPVPCPFEPDR